MGEQSWADPNHYRISLKGREMPSAVQVAKRQLQALARRSNYDGILIKASSSGKRGTVTISGEIPPAAVEGVFERLGHNYTISSERRH